MFYRLCSTASATMLVIAVFCMVSVSQPAFAEGEIVADRQCLDLDAVPNYFINIAKAKYRMSYGHTSHGSQIISGINVIKGTAGSQYWWDHDGTAGGLSIYDYTPSGDLGNPDRTTWATRTRAMLDDDNNTRNLVMWSWCGQAATSEENMQIYLDLMDGLIAEYPEVTFIYMTGHLNGTGVDGSLHLRNNQIRDHVAATGGVLFDFADIESYRMEDELWLVPYDADDGCNYYYEGSHNWADDWCGAHPTDPLCASCSCAHSRSMNCNLKARVFWWMMARLGGWNGISDGDIDDGGYVDLDDYNAFSDCMAGPGVAPSPTGTTPERCLEVFDFDSDLDVDLSDFEAFHGVYGAQ